MSIVQHFDTDVVELLASAGSVSRGRAYAAAGKVTITTLSDTELRADVWGTTRYRVRLWTDGGTHRWRCDCPVGLNGEFCKHTVAALAAATDPAAGEASSAAVDAGSTERDRLARFVGALPAEQLVALLLEQAELDDEFRTRLTRLAQLQEAGPASGPGGDDSLDLRSLKKEVTAAFGRGFIS